MHEETDIKSTENLEEIIETIKEFLSMDGNKIRKEEDRFKIILNNIPSLILVYDKSQKLIYSNSFLEQYFGYSLLDFYYKGIASFVFEEDKIAFNELFKSKNSKNLSIRINNKNGELKSYKILSSYFVNEFQDYILLMISKNGDSISPQEGPDHNFELLFDQLSDMIIIHTEDEKILNVNKVFIERTGYKESEIVGKHLYDFDIEFEKLKSENNDRNGLNLLKKLVTKIQEELFIKSEHIALGDGKYATILKITSSNKNDFESFFEKFIGHIFQNLQIGYLILNPNGNIRHLSSNLFDITGVAEDIWNNSKPFIEDVVREEDFALLKRKLDIAVKGNLIKDQVIFLKISEEHFLKVSMSLIPVIDNPDDRDFDVILTICEYKEPARIESDDFYHYLVNSAPIGIVTFNKDGDYTTVNEEFLKLLGYEYDRDVVLSWNIHNLIDRDKMLPGFVKALEGETIGYIRDYMPMDSKQKFSFYQVFAPLRNMNEEIVGVLGLLNEITDTSIIPQNFLESEERYRKIFENIDDVLIIHNSLGKITSFNQKALESFGYDSEELIKLNFWDLFEEKDSEEFEDKIFNLNSFGKIDFHSVIKTKNDLILKVRIIGKGVEVSGIQNFLEIVIIDKKEDQDA